MASFLSPPDAELLITFFQEHTFNFEIKTFSQLVAKFKNARKRNPNLESRKEF